MATETAQDDATDRAAVIRLDALRALYADDLMVLWAQRLEARRHPKGTRRRTDHHVQVQRFNMAGEPVHTQAKP